MLALWAMGLVPAMAVRAAGAQAAPAAAGLVQASPAPAAALAPVVSAPRAARIARLMSGRALWVKRDQMTTPERIVRFVDEAAENGYTVLFVQVRGRGDAWYRSDLVPLASLLADARGADGAPFDPLDYLLRRAHARGIEVHVWLNALLVWSGDTPPDDPGHVMNRHPDWVAVDADGRSLADYSPADVRRANIEGVFLAAGNPAVREHLRQVIGEIAGRYAVDGIHLDYIRCPLVDSGYDRASRAAFMAECGVDPWKLRHGDQGLKERFGAGGLADLERRWRGWRAAQVTRLVREIRGDLDRLDRPVLLSTAVFPDYRTAPSDVGQDWMTWCRGHLVDMVVPMFYSKSTDAVLRQLEVAQRAMPLDVLLYAGLAVYNQPLESVVEKALLCQRQGAQGICFFPYDTLAERPGSLRQLSRMSFGARSGRAAGLDNPVQIR